MLIQQHHYQAVPTQMCSESQSDITSIISGSSMEHNDISNSNNIQDR